VRRQACLEAAVDATAPFAARAGFGVRLWRLQTKNVFHVGCCANQKAILTAGLESSLYVIPAPRRDGYLCSRNIHYLEGKIVGAINGEWLTRRTASRAAKRSAYWLAVRAPIAEKLHCLSEICFRQVHAKFTWYS
jgi:hypothetical protein